jgi:midasin
MVFEWHDGILVEAMQNGGLLLIDEISLANDSVLERLNSVFEQDRVLILSEKSSTEAVKVDAK